MEYVDTLISKGKIYTLKEGGDLVEALAIDKGKIIFAGSKDESQKYIASEIVDLGGKTVISGMGDSHLHLYAYCQNKALINLESVKSMDALIQTIRARALETEKGRWLKGVGFDQNKYPESRLPNRWDLDKISREHPIVIRRCCLHVMVANSLAIEMASITEEDIKKFDGLIELDDRGEMTGIFREAATSIFDDIVPDPLSEAEVKQKIMLEVFDEMVSKGITIIHTYSANIWNYFEDIDTYRLLESEGKLPIRIIVNLDELFENDGINWDD
ncbi:MAG: amidohydrolase family protein [Clostridiales bacterium]|nr:amidohydrolase family protein [Clostridiales bacterium]